MITGKVSMITKDIVTHEVTITIKVDPDDVDYIDSDYWPDDKVELKNKNPDRC